MEIRKEYFEAASNAYDKYLLIEKDDKLIFYGRSRYDNSLITLAEMKESDTDIPFPNLEEFYDKVKHVLINQHMTWRHVKREIYISSLCGL